MTAHALTHAHPDHQGSSHAVCQALGCDTDFVDDLWINSGTAPPFYPNAITTITWVSRRHSNGTGNSRRVSRCITTIITT